MTARKSSSVIFTIRASRVMPALLTSTATSPAASTIRARSSGLVTSATSPSTDGSRSTRSTSWSAASRSATALADPARGAGDDRGLIPGSCPRASRGRGRVRRPRRGPPRAARSSAAGPRGRRPAPTATALARWPSAASVRMPLSSALARIAPGAPRWPSRSSWESTKTIGSPSRAAACARRNASSERGLDPAEVLRFGSAVKIMPPAACSAGSCPSASSAARRRTR